MLFWVVYCKYYIFIILLCITIVGGVGRMVDAVCGVCRGGLVVVYVVDIQYYKY